MGAEVNELVEFLTARLDEAARGAEASGPHVVAWLTFCDADGQLQYTAVGSSADERGESGIWIVDGKEAPTPTFVHAIYDPALALREVEAKRRIMARHKPVGPSRYRTVRDELNCEGCGWEGEHGDPVTEDIDECPELRDLASIYEGAPGWQERWRV